MIRLAVAGALGRMGRRVLELAAADERFEVIATLTRTGSKTPNAPIRVGARELRPGTAIDHPCDVLIDFTTPDGTIACLEVCEARRIAIVSGVTGHNEQQLARMRSATRLIPILHASNFSVGIQALLKLVGSLASQLGEAYDVEIVETHHRQKIDAPSGTALSLVDAIVQSRRAGSRGGKPHLVFGRQELTGPRVTGEIGVHAIRIGDVVGEHEVHFDGCGERITVGHVAHTRDAFAAGALRAAAWIAGKPAGWYTLADVVAGPSGSA